MAQETHRSGNLKQQNKSHKHGRHRTKGEVNRNNQGRVNVKTLTKKQSAAEKQAVRRNQAKQARQLKRQQCFEKKRQRGGQHSPPHFVVVVGLTASADCSAAVDLLCQCVEGMEGGLVTRNDQGMVHLSIPRFKQRLACFIPSSGLHAILDAAKVADSVLFVTSPDDVIDDMGDYCLKCLMAQGLSGTSFVCPGLNQVPTKKLADTKKMISKEIERRIPDGKVHSLDNDQDAVLLIRRLTEGKTKPVYFRELRPHMIAESLRFEAESEEATEGVLKVSGFLRGMDMSADQLVHVVGWGTFQIAQITGPTDPHPLVLKKEKAGKASSSMEVGGDDDDGDGKVLARPDPRCQVSLQDEIEVDPMAEEQTWPTQQELEEAEGSAAKGKPKVLDYQGHWLFPEDISDDDEDSGEEGEEEEEEDMEEESDSDDDSWKTCDDEEDTESVAMTETEIPDDKYDVHFDIEAEKLQLQQLREERENIMFPDEVDTPVDVPARERFAKYRGLSSFRTSLWPADQELFPTDYQRIFNPGNIKALKKRILKSELTNSVTVGQYVTVHIAGVPKAYMESYTPSTPVVLFGLLPFEQKMTVVHLAVKRDAICQDTVRSKTRLHFQVGFRRFSACPIFSQLKKGDKHKMERFLPYDETVVMTVYAPLTVGPCPTMVFKTNSFGEEHLVGTGSLHTISPERIILKRAVLSGHILKMGKRKVVVRFMFFNREDIEWFKPVELRTKMGKHGRIKEALGTHGHMKCVFNSHPKSQDVVLMYLYKRVFPKWTYEAATPL